MMNPSMALCQSLDATLATTRLWLHRTQFHDVPRPQAYAFAYLDDRLRKSKNNYFYCRWQDSGTMELDGTGWNWILFGRASPSSTPAPVSSNYEKNAEPDPENQHRENQRFTNSLLARAEKPWIRPNFWGKV